MKEKIITINSDTEILSIDLDFGHNKQFYNDFLDVIERSESNVPYQVLKGADIHNDRWLVRFQVYYNAHNPN